MQNIVLAFENQEAANPALYNEWVRISVLFGDSKRMQIGIGAYRHPGLVTAQIFIRKGIGIDRGVEIADLISGALRDQVVSNVIMLVPSVIKVPVMDDVWHQVQVATPFYFDEVT